MKHTEKESTYTKSPWRWACLVLAVLSGLCLACQCLPGLLPMLLSKVTNASSIGVIGGADGPTSIFVATAETSSQSVTFYVLLLAMGVIGFIALSRIKQDKENPL